MHTFPPICSVWCYACHACLCQSLAIFAFLHTCSHVHAWVLLASVLSTLQHNEAMDTWSKPTFLPCGHHILFACLPFCLFTCCLACLPYLLCLFASCLYHVLFASFPSIACLLVSCLCLWMYTHGEKTYGYRARFPRCKQKGRKCEHGNISQTVVFSRFKGLAFPIWWCTLLNPLPSSPLSLLDGLY